MPNKFSAEDLEMERNNQSQSAGDNAQQIQAGTINIYQGITEERARELITEMSQKAISENTAEAFEVANQRMEQFANQLIPRIQQIEESFNSFSDPSFQVLLRKAQLTAACTEREDDYKILSELLVHRVKNKANIKKKASISKAMEIVDQIDDDSLLALTVFQSMENFVPTSGNISEGLQAISDLYEKFDLDKLPHDILWVDNLSILGAISVSSFGKLKKFEDYFSTSLPGYVCAGIKKDSDDYTKALEIMSTCGIGEGYFEENILLDGYVRLPVRNQKAIEDLLFDGYINDNGKIILIKLPISKERFECLNTVFDMYSKDEDAITTAKSNFVKILHSYPAIHAAIEWWNSIPMAISLTSVGKVIGHTNAKAIDNTLPDLD